MKILNSSTLLVSLIISSCLWKLSDQHNHKDCIHQCGERAIPYPFGIGPDYCSLSPDFGVSCISFSSSSQIPFLKKLNLEIFEVRNSDFPKFYGTVFVKIPSVTACNDTEIRWNGPNLGNSIFSFYSQDSLMIPSKNVFVSVGCHGYALFYNQYGDSWGCTSVCTPDNKDLLSTPDRMDQCYGFNNCCLISDMMVSDQYRISVSVHNGLKHCRSAYLISQDYLATLESAVAPMPAVPVVLHWINKDMFSGNSSMIVIAFDQ